MKWTNSGAFPVVVPAVKSATRAKFFIGRDIVVIVEVLYPRHSMQPTIRYRALCSIGVDRVPVRLTRRMRAPDIVLRAGSPIRTILPS